MGSEKKSKIITIILTIKYHSYSEKNYSTVVKTTYFKMNYKDLHSNYVIISYKTIDTLIYLFLYQLSYL